MSNAVCKECGQYVPCKEICPHCQAAHCEVRWPHTEHQHAHCARNSELGSRWGGPVVPVGPAPIMGHSPVGIVGHVPGMSPLVATHPHVSPPNPSTDMGVVTQGAEPPADLPENLQRELGLVK